MRIIELFVVIAVLCGCTFAQKRMTDAQFEGLKGRVKTVRTFDSNIETRNGKPVQTPRKLQFSEEYDESGNMTQSAAYTIGRRRLFKLIDGKKTSKSEDFDVPGRSVFKVIGTLGTNKEHAPPDVRFDTRYEYEFDGHGRITEEKRYGNDGSLHSRWTYRYSPAGLLIEQLTHEGGSITDREVTVFDNAGTVIKRSFIPTDSRSGESETTHLFRDYKLDTHGNWIQRTQTTIYFTNGVKKQFDSVSYREITYFP